MDAKPAVSAIGVRELEEHTREVLRRVREGGEIIEVADSDGVIARIVPVKAVGDVEAFDDWWEQIDHLAEEISKHWPEGVSAAEAVAEQRREL